MSLSRFSDFDELENLGLLDDAIANATERRNIAANQDDSLPELLDEEASSVMGGLTTASLKCKPPITWVGLIAQDPQANSGQTS